jgi:8-oxo-dGTP pyrophosphatase MutT (NUDIX family)
MRATLIHDIPVEVDIGWLRRRFADGTPPPGMIYGDQGTRPGEEAGRSDRPELRPAAVLIPIVARDNELTVLLTQRTAHLKAHSGQVSFPGGKAEPGDLSEESTALRETLEEIGLASERVELLGRLSRYHTRTGFRVTPVVGVVTPPFELRPDVQEVEEVFEVPLSFLLDPANHQRHSRELQGRQVPYFAIPYGRHYIWGATAAMLINFYRFLAETG